MTPEQNDALREELLALTRRMAELSEGDPQIPMLQQRCDDIREMIAGTGELIAAIRELLGLPKASPPRS